MTSPVPIEKPHRTMSSEVEVLEQRVQVGGEGVVVVADGRLARAAEAAAVVADAAVAGGEQLALLALPGVAVERVPWIRTTGWPVPWSS